MRPWRKFPAGLYRYLDAERLVMFAKKHKVALVHSSDLWLSGYMIWIAKRLKIPSVLHVRTPISVRNVRKHRCSKADVVIAISRRIRRNLLCAGIVPEKIKRIHDSVDLGIFRPENNNGNVLRRDFPAIGNVLVGLIGRIAPSKRQLVFLQAAERVIRDSGKSVTFFLIGENHNPDYFEKLKKFVRKNGLNKKVIFTDRRDDIQQVLNSLDILVSLSGGSVMFEAAACGKTVISAEVNGNSQSVLANYTRSRPIVLASGCAGLVEAMIRLINDSGIRKQIGSQSRNWAKSYFCHYKMAAKTEKLYDKLLS